MLIIGCGNRQRGDDAAGIRAAERLRGLGIDVEICSGESTDLMELWSGADDVMVIDAVQTGAEAGTVHLFDAQHMPHGKVSGSTHGLGIAEAIQLSHALNKLPAKLQVYGIEGKNYAVGNTVSPEVEDAVEEVVRRIVTELKP